MNGPTLKIIYQDQNLLVVDKPAGLVVDPAQTVKEDTLADILSRDFGIKLFRGGIVHRLDKDTSGLLAVAKTQQALENLQAQFKNREVEKEYLALVHGTVLKAGKVDAAIARNPQHREKFTVSLQGDALEARQAVTEYEPVKHLRFDNVQLTRIFPDFNKIQFRKLSTTHYNLFTLVTCRPKTGRTHQIRVHLKYIGHPVVSDEKYTGRKVHRLDRRWCSRQFLHAAKLVFVHPVTGQKMVLESQLPEDLTNCLKLLKSNLSS